jgi:hypothetical protein
MSADLVNLRQARKLRERARKRAQADESAAKHGLTRAERALQQARAAQARAHLDAHRRAPGPETE